MSPKPPLIPNSPPKASSEAVLYISYDGVLEPLGDSQVVAYLRPLASGRPMFLVSYEKPEDLGNEPRFKACAAALREAGIAWIPLRYHREPSVAATAYDVAAGFLRCAGLVLRRRIGLVHARSYVPALIAWALKRVLGVRFIFDMRGFWADQRLETGSWRQGSAAYRAAKWFERRFLLEADAVVTLTRAAVEVIEGLPYMKDRRQRVETITTCADLERFRPEEPLRSPRRGFLVGFVGAVSVSYRLDDMIECFEILRRLRPDARLLILNRYDHSLLRARLAAWGVDPSVVSMRSVDHSRMAGEISALDAAIFLLKAFPALKGSAPTKLGELLGCGVPCLSNDGIGDYGRILREENVGVVLESFTRVAKEEALARLLELAAQPGVRRRCRAAAERHFSLERGVEAYARLYGSLGAGAGAPGPRAGLAERRLEETRG